MTPMPYSCLLIAATNLLRGAFSDKWDAGVPTSPTGIVVGVQYGGQPPPAAGQVYYGIHCDSVRNDAKQADHQVRIYGLRVTITLKTGGAPIDRQGRSLITREADGILDRAELLADMIHGNYALLTAANALIGGPGDTTQGFVEPLLFANFGMPESKSADWFWSEDASRGASGLAITVSFAGAKFVRKTV